MQLSVQGIYFLTLPYFTSQNQKKKKAEWKKNSHCWSLSWMWITVNVCPRVDEIEWQLATSSNQGRSLNETAEGWEELVCLSVSTSMWRHVSVNLSTSVFKSVTTWVWLGAWGTKVHGFAPVCIKIGIMHYWESFFCYNVGPDWEQVVN